MRVDDEPKKIRDELSRVLELHENIGSEFVTSKEYQDDREWWILGHFCILLEKSGCEFPVFATKSEQKTPPDFITFDHEKKLFNPIELTEVITPGRERTREYRNGKYNNEIENIESESIEVVPDPWSSFIKRLKDKFLKGYGRDSWLVIFHDMCYEEISSMGYWHSTLLANAKIWQEEGMINFTKFQGEKIFVVNNNCNACVTLFPKFDIIVPER